MPTYTQIGTAQVVGLLGASSIDFTSIPSTYTDLVIKYSLRSTTAQNFVSFSIRFNSDSGSNYTTRLLYGTGSTAGSDVNTSTSTTQWQYGTGSTATTSTFGNGEVYIPNYLSSNAKSLSSDSVSETNATSSITGLKAGLWTGTAAITSISLYDPAGSLVQYSTAYLYGVSNA